MSDTEVESLNTMSPLTFPEIVDIIKEAAKDCSASHDNISFLTVVDIYFEDWNAYSIEERVELMELFYTIISENKELLAEIAWDIPPLLLNFMDGDWPMMPALRDNIQITLAFKVFNLVSEFGNPKELFLTCVEEIKKLSDPKSDNLEMTQEQINILTRSLSDEDKENVVDLDAYIFRLFVSFNSRKAVLKFRALFECMKFSFLRIKTIYPSKFLSLIVSTILNYMTNCYETSYQLSILRILYLFIRDYVPPDAPDDIFKTESEEVIEKIFADESYLQRKLIVLLADSIIDKFGQGHFRVLVAKILPSTVSQNYEVLGQPYYELMDRLLTLSLSLDIKIPDSLVHEVEKADDLFAKSLKTVNSSEDIIKLVISSYNNTSFRNKSSTELLSPSPSSLIILFAYAKYSENWTMELPDSISTLSLIKLQLTVFIPYLVDYKLTNLTSVIYFMTITIMKIEKEKIVLTSEELNEESSKLLIITYLQNIASIISNIPSVFTDTATEMFTKLYSSFILKFLQHLPEDFAYEYMIDSIDNCPFDDNTLCMLKVFKKLISTAKFDNESLVKDFSKLSLNKGETNTDKKPAIPLPPRSSNQKNSFISFSPERQETFISVFRKCYDDVFDKSSAHGINSEKVKKLVGFIKFAETVNFNDFEKIESILKDIKDSISVVQKNLEEKTGDDVKVIQNTLKFLQTNTSSEVIEA